MWLGNSIRSSIRGSPIFLVWNMDTLSSAWYDWGNLWWSHLGQYGLSLSLRKKRRCTIVLHSQSILSQQGSTRQFSFGFTRLYPRPSCVSACSYPRVVTQPNTSSWWLEQPKRIQKVLNLLASSNSKRGPPTIMLPIMGYGCPSCDRSHHVTPEKSWVYIYIYVLMNKDWWPFPN